jgi:hypothetical protein
MTASVTDIVTYIGVPLAVLGVLPILYTSIRAFLMKLDIRGEFARNGLSNVIVRGSLVSLVVEIELPCYSIAPTSRSEEKYWRLNAKPSCLKGGSWSMFHWEMMEIGHYVYKVQEAYRGGAKATAGGSRLCRIGAILAGSRGKAVCGGV